jgi:LmbE family N-acetylglucosaminyl deacetylase
MNLFAPDRICPERIAIVVAHPDDEVIGAGGQLHRWPNVHFIHVTNGSPRDLSDARNAGCSSRQEYAVKRRAEFACVLKYLNLPPTHARSLGFGDQETAFHLSEIVAALRACFAELKPDFVLTHPYEGGHPDHDATAFAVQRSAPCPAFEMAGYHLFENKLRTGEFLQAGEIVVCALTPAEQTQKRALFDCYKTQWQTLSLFRTDVEKFRPAARYDFTEPPHPGPLHYEKYPWNMTAQRWCELAREAA